MKKIMFLCTGNSCRSQMAEGFCRKYWGHSFTVFSAGTKKHGMNERAIKVMKEAGVDISGQYSKTTDELPVVTFEYVITVCDSAKENCPERRNRIGHQKSPDNFGRTAFYEG